MKPFVSALLVLACVNAYSQVFNFYGTEYYLSPDENSAPGTVLTASGTDLSGFNFSNAPADHPLFATGIYFPVSDCGQNNLWVRLQHIAHDPNGIENGYAISQTLNSPFLPIGSTDRIGGWAGFLYDIQIFADASLTGTRQNILADHFPTQIIVESLETLYNDGGSLWEWLSFEILNEETDGWQLLSTNFTGINPFSNPGFSAELVYSTPVVGNAPEGFSTEFPFGSNSIYAIDLNLSSAQHSEFRMSASDVTHFRYGYEFTTGGYQGMSMAFGGSPSLFADIVPQCGDEGSGIIIVDATGTPPFTYNWSTGDSGESVFGLEAGDYVVTVTDANGCTGETTYTVPFFPDAFNASISAQDDGQGLILTAQGIGVGEPFTYEWNTGETTASILSPGPGVYTVTVTNSQGCQATAEFAYVGIDGRNASSVAFFPNPFDQHITLRGVPAGAMIRLITADGRIVRETRQTQEQISTIDTSDLTSGVYLMTVILPDGQRIQQQLVKVH
jgi:hypothetical protein